MTGIARLGDSTTGYCSSHKKIFTGVIISASTDSLCNGFGVARVGDIVASSCGHTGTIISGSTDTFCNGAGVARLGDSFTGTYSGTIISASTDTNAN